ncbi:MAG: hypothetical protein AB7G62_01460 [Magnetospirillum sp.]
MTEKNFYSQVNKRKAQVQPKPSHQPAGRDLLTLAGSPTTVIAPVNRPDVSESPLAEVGPTATFDHNARARKLDELF